MPDQRKRIAAVAEKRPGVTRRDKVMPPVLRMCYPLDDWTRIRVWDFREKMMTYRSKTRSSAPPGAVQCQNSGMRISLSLFGRHVNLACVGDKGKAEELSFPVGTDMTHDSCGP